MTGIAIAQNVTASSCGGVRHKRYSGAGSGRSLQSLFHCVPQRISAATLHARFWKLGCFEYYCTLFLP